MNKLTAEMIVKCHEFAQLGSRDQCEYIADGGHIVCEDESFSIEEWLRQNQLLWFIDMVDSITVRVLADMIENNEHHNDEIGFYESFYRRMMPVLQERWDSLN